MNAELPSTHLLNPLAARSPLGTVRGAAPRTIADTHRVCIVEEPFLHLVSLRLSRKASVEALAAAFGSSLPLTPNTFSGTAARSVARFEPHAWMLLASEPPQAPSIAGCLATDLSARLASFRLTGDGAESLLRGSTPVMPPVGGFVRTLFAESYAVLQQRLDAHDVRLLVDVSLAQACADWLADAAQLASTG
ncbi:MAG TPA: hypothetical protein VJM11_20135 [Nevskiaceae bacterium]|nr:hypothetical protein [Nevskiaceae bacterium]